MLYRSDRNNYSKRTLKKKKKIIEASSSTIRALVLNVFNKCQFSDIAYAASVFSVYFFERTTTIYSSRRDVMEKNTSDGSIN